MSGLYLNFKVQNSKDHKKLEKRCQRNWKSKTRNYGNIQIKTLTRTQTRTQI